MAGALPHYKAGPASYTAAALIIGGQLVRPAVSGDDPPSGLVNIGVVPAGVGSNTILGVAGADANSTMFLDYLAAYGPDSGPSFPVGWTGNGGDPDTVFNGTGEYQDPNLDVSILTFTVPVWNNVDIVVNYAASAAFGELLVAAADGAVTPWTSGTTTFDLIVGRCTQPNGVSGAGVGRAFIRV